MREPVVGSGWRAIAAMSAIAVFAVAMPIPAASAKGPLYTGIWATSAANCKAPRDGSSSPIRLSAKLIEEFEVTCKLSAINRQGATWTAKARCDDLGTITRERVTIWASAKLLTLKWSTNAQRLNYVRCK